MAADDEGRGGAAPSEAEGPDAAAATMRGPELAVAGALMLLAGLAIADSLRVGIGWADDGPRAGYFPFYIGLILLGASGFVFVRALLQWRELGAPFATRREFGGVWAVFWPSAVAVALMPFAGLYVASALLIAFFMRRHGGYGWAAAAVVSVGVTVAFFLVFERWFLVPLPKGPLEAWLGL